MASYVKFELEDGTVVYVETTEAPRGSSGLIPGGRGEHADEAAVSFDKAVDGVRKLAASMLNNLRREEAGQPEEVQINFGLKASADVGGLVISRGGMESNFNVMLRWRSEPKKDEAGEEASEEEPSKKEKQK